MPGDELPCFPFATTEIEYFVPQVSPFAVKLAPVWSNELPPNEIVKLVAPADVQENVIDDGDPAVPLTFGASGGPPLFFVVVAAVVVVDVLHAAAAS